MKENNNDLHEFTSAAEKCTFNPHNTSRHVFMFFIWTVSFPATFDSTHISFLSLFSLMHAYTVGRAHTQKHTFRNLWPGRQSSFINFWVWVQYSVFLDSHLRAIINAGMLAEHPDLPAQICRHHCEGRAGKRPNNRPSQLPSSQTNTTKMETETKSKKASDLSTTFLHLQTFSAFFFSHLKPLDIS